MVAAQHFHHLKHLKIAVLTHCEKKKNCSLEVAIVQLSGKRQCLGLRLRETLHPTS
jgi:hypothetical protein